MNNKKPVAQNYVYQKNPDKFTKKCKYCKQVIDKKASVCPYCLRRQPTSCLGWILATLFIAIVMGVIIYYGLTS